MPGTITTDELDMTAGSVERPQERTVMIRPVAVTDRTGLTQALRALKLSGMLATLDARLAPMPGS
jgi:hypothetical protein